MTSRSFSVQPASHHSWALGSQILRRLGSLVSRSWDVLARAGSSSVVPLYSVGPQFSLAAWLPGGVSLPLGCRHSAGTQGCDSEPATPRHRCVQNGVFHLPSGKTTGLWLVVDLPIRPILSANTRAVRLLRCQRCRTCVLQSHLQPTLGT